MLPDFGTIQLIIYVVIAIIVLFVVLAVAFFGVSIYQHQWEPVKGGTEEDFVTIYGTTPDGQHKILTAVWRNVTPRYEHRRGTMEMIQIARNDALSHIRGLVGVDGHAKGPEAAKRIAVLRREIIGLNHMGAFGDHMKLLSGRSMSTGTRIFIVQYANLGRLSSYATSSMDVGGQFVLQVLARLTRGIVKGWIEPISPRVSKSWESITSMPVGGEWYKFMPLIPRPGRMVDPYVAPPPTLAVQMLAASPTIQQAIAEQKPLMRRVAESQVLAKNALSRLSEKTIEGDEISLALHDTGTEQPLQLRGSALAAKMIGMIAAVTVLAVVAGSYFGGNVGAVFGAIAGVSLGGLLAITGIVPGVKT